MNDTATTNAPAPLVPKEVDLRALRDVESAIARLEFDRASLGVGMADSASRKAIGRSLRALRLQAARLRGTHTETDWRELVRRFGGRCVRCGNHVEHLDKDHIIPVCAGGSDAIGNLQPICPRCNCAKGLEATNWVAYREKHGFEREAAR